MTMVQLRNALLDRQPFEPKRVVMSDGRSYLVRHPELVMVGVTSTVVGIPAAEGVGLAADHFVTLSNDHITSVVPAGVLDRV
jgi:hypothetical protein